MFSNKAQLVYVILQLLIGLMCFATILGYIASIVTNISAARKDFQGEIIFFATNLFSVTIMFIFLVFIFLIMLLLDS